MFVSLLFLLQASDPAPTPPPEKRVLVTASRHDADLLDVPSSVTLITREDIAASNAHDVVDLLRALPGVSLQKFSSTPQDSAVESRGFLNGGGAGSRSVVLVDGRRVNGVTTGTADWAGIPLDDVERIEIIRGPGTALYGDGALGTVISITTRRAGKTPRHAAELEAGSFRSFRETGSFAASDGPAGVSVLATHRSSAGYRENSGFDGHDASAAFTYNVGSGKVYIRLSGHDDDRRRPGTLSLAEIDQVGRRGTVTMGDESTIGSQTAQIGSDFEIGGGTLSQMVAFTRDRAKGSITGAGPSLFVSDDESSRLALGLKFVRTMGEFTVLGGLDGTIDGAQADSDYNDPFFSSQSDQEYKRTIWSPYARAEWKAEPGLILSGSLRHDRAETSFDVKSQDTFSGASETEGDKSFTHVSGQVGVTWHLRPEATVYASWGNAVRFPNRDELTGFIISGLELDPERASTIEVGLRSRESELLGGGLSVYRMTVRDEIFFLPPDVGAVGVFGSNINIPETLHRGVELELESKPCATFQAFGTATLQETTVSDGPHDGNRFPLTPRLAGSLGARSEVVDGLTVQGVWRYVGERFLINDIENASDQLPAYGVVDLKCSYQRKALTLFAEVDNAADRRYFDNGGLRSPAFLSPFPGEAAFSPAPGRNYVVGGSVEF